VIEVFLVDATAEETISACKKNPKKYAILTLIFLQNFLGAYSPHPHSGELGYGVATQTPPEGDT